jgi:DNA (cytosine-5)-methyltransferase 1
VKRCLPASAASACPPFRLGKSTGPKIAGRLGAALKSVPAIPSYTAGMARPREEGFAVSSGSGSVGELPQGCLSSLDLFAGAGGLAEGFRRAGGFNTVGAVEMDSAAAATFSLNHPDAETFAGDIVSWISHQNIQPVDVVVGGPPCQGFSNLGHRRARDPRNALWRRYVDVLLLSGPKYFVLENVADFLRSGQFESMRQATRPSGRLRDYRIDSAVLNAADFGVPQVRKRAIVIGSHRDLPPPGLPVGPLEGQPSSWRTVRDALNSVPYEVDAIDLPRTTMTITGNQDRPGPFKTSELHLGRRPTSLSLARYRAIPEGGNRMDLPDELKAPCWVGHRSGSGDVMGRLIWDKPSVTIRTEFWKPEKGRYLHPAADRPITLMEGALLQGFPEDYLWCGSKTEIGRQIGNAVPIALSAAIGRHLRSQLHAG